MADEASEANNGRFAATLKELRPALSYDRFPKGGALGGSLAPGDLKACADVAGALAEVAEASSLRKELLAALDICNATPSDLYRLFIKELPPFASIYLSCDGNIGGDSTSVIAGFYSALGVPTASNPDHLAELLRLLATILGKEADLAGAGTNPSNEKHLASVSRARSVLVADHLATWFPAYLLRAKEVAPSPLSGWVCSALDLMSILVGEDQSTGLTLEAPNKAVSAFSSEMISWITSPGRSGLIITPWDLTNLAESLGLAVRIGRKRFVLEELWARAGEELLVNLHLLALRQMNLFDAYSSSFPSLQAWAERAGRTAELLSVKARTGPTDARES